MSITLLVEPQMNEFVQIPAGVFWGGIGTAIASVALFFKQSLNWVAKKLEAERTERQNDLREQTERLEHCQNSHRDAEIKNAVLSTRIDTMEKYTGPAFAATVATATADAVVKALQTLNAGVQSK